MKSIERIIYIGVIFLCFMGMYNSCNRNKQLQVELVSVNDTLTKTITKKGEEKTATDLLLGTVKDFKAMHASDSSSIGKLQKLVDKLSISATYLNNVTHNNLYSATQGIIQHDTVIGKDGIKNIYPEYRDTIKNKWEDFKISANKDSFHIQYKVFNEFEIKQTWKRNGLFRHKTAIAEITNLNPHTETKDLKSFTVAENKGNRLRDFLFGVLASAILIEGLKIIPGR